MAPPRNVPRRKAGGLARKRQLQRLPRGWRHDILKPINAYLAALRLDDKRKPLRERQDALNVAVAAALRNHPSIRFVDRSIPGWHPAEPFTIVAQALVSELIARVGHLNGHHSRYVASAM